ncbi:MAG: Hpt domain-containing protein, partial [Desulfovibrio sp.]
KSLASVLERELHERLQTLDAAIAMGDFEQLRRTAHACKNSAGVMRLDHLRAAATATEEAQSAHISEEAQKLRTAMQKAAQVLGAGVEQGKIA